MDKPDNEDAQEILRAAAQADKTSLTIRCAMNTQGITERLHAKADAQLTAEISKALEPIWNLMGRDSQPHKFKAIRTTDAHTEVEVYWRESIKGIKAMAFEHHRDAFRQKVVDEFMAKVESLSEQVEQLRNI